MDTDNPPNPPESHAVLRLIAPDVWQPADLAQDAGAQSMYALRRAQAAAARGDLREAQDCAARAERWATRAADAAADTRTAGRVVTWRAGSMVIAHGHAAMVAERWAAAWEACARDNASKAHAAAQAAVQAAADAWYAGR